MDIVDESDGDPGAAEGQRRPWWFFPGLAAVAIGALVGSLIGGPTRPATPSATQAPTDLLGAPVDAKALPSQPPAPYRCFIGPVAAPRVTPASLGGGFARARGLIAYSDGEEIVAVDPTNALYGAWVVEAWDLQPIVWSADGSRLLVRASVPRQPDAGTSWRGTLVALNADGSATGITCGSPSGSFSPDGNTLAFVVPGGGVYLAPVSGGEARLLDPDRSTGCCPKAVAWSPDGSRIAFLDFVEDSREWYGLSFVNPDGSDLQKLALLLPPTDDAGGLVWSPDGSRLAFWMPATGLEGSGVPEGRLAIGPSEIFVINADGSGLRQLTHSDYAAPATWPAWSPDGSRIAFERGGELFTMAADGSDVRRIEGITGVVGSIAWNPAR